MGNYVSCALMSNSSMKNSSRVTKVIFQNGEIRQYKDESVKASEIMLENPNFFVVNSTSLYIGRRFSPLAADEDLEFGNVYVMFPMKRLNSFVTAGDMAAMFMAANSGKAKKNMISARQVGILPEVIDNAVPENEHAGFGGEVDGFTESKFKYKMMSCGSRKPILETIKEEPAWPLVLIEMLDSILDSLSLANVVATFIGNLNDVLRFSHITHGRIANNKF